MARFLLDIDWVIDHFNGIAAIRTVGDFDLFIAATALRHGLTICTNDRRLFEVIDGAQLIGIAEAIIRHTRRGKPPSRALRLLTSPPSPSLSPIAAPWEARRH
jgi:hypothetical protein